MPTKEEKEIAKQNRKFTSDMKRSFIELAKEERNMKRKEKEKVRNAEKQKKDEEKRKKAEEKRYYQPLRGKREYIVPSYVRSSLENVGLLKAVEPLVSPTIILSQLLNRTNS